MRSTSGLSGVGGGSPRSTATMLAQASSTMAAARGGGGRSDVGQQHHVVELGQTGRQAGLVLVDVEPGRGDGARAQRLDQRRLVDQRAAGGVDQHRGRLHPGQGGGVDQVAALVVERRVQR